MSQERRYIPQIGSRVRMRLYSDYTSLGLPPWTTLHCVGLEGVGDNTVVCQRSLTANREHDGENWVSGDAPMLPYGDRVELKSPLKSADKTFRMSSFVATPPRVRSPFKTKNGTLPLGFQPPRPSNDNKPSHDNPYLRRLKAFRKELLENPPFTLVSLFCGGGGLDLGLSFAGFGTRVASDVAPAFVDSVVTNLPHAKACKEDALELTKEKLCKLAETTKIDLVAAGPPCQSFSILGQRGALADPRGKLALKYFDLIADIKPKAFLFENVPGLLTVNKGQDWKTLAAYAKEKTGYHLHVARLNAEDFGIPQVRERVILIGLRQNVPFEFPTLPSGPGAEDIIASLAERDGEGVPSAWALTDVDGLPNHDIRQHGPRVKERYNKIEPGSRDRTDHTDRIDPNRPSGTVLVGSGGGGGRPHIHPKEPRVITVREAARLQSFPDWYVFQGTNTAQYRQVGNAVPPLLAYEVGKKIAEAIARFK